MAEQCRRIRCIRIKWRKSCALTVFECLNDFRVARLTFDTAIEWRNEKFVFGVLFQIANDVRLARRTHHCHDVVFLWTAAEVAESNVQSLHKRKQRIRIIFLRSISQWGVMGEWEWEQTSMYSSVLLMCKCQSNRTAVEFMAIASFNSTTCESVNWIKSSLAFDKSSHLSVRKRNWTHLNQGPVAQQIVNATLFSEFSFGIAVTSFGRCSQKCFFLLLQPSCSTTCTKRNDDYAARKYINVYLRCVSQCSQCTRFIFHFAFGAFSANFQHLTISFSPSPPSWSWTDHTMNTRGKKCFHYFISRAKMQRTRKLLPPGQHSAVQPKPN